MTSHRDSHTITDVKWKMIPGIKTGNGIPHDLINVIYAALPMRAQTEKMIFSCKDDCK